MTNLTDKWNKGKLPEGFYYVRCAWSDEIEIRYVHNGVDDWQEIVAEVPSYEQWQKHRKTLLKTQEKNCDLEIKNTKLKDLLKEIRGKLHYINTPVNQHNIFSNDFIKRLDQVLGAKS